MKIATLCSGIGAPEVAAKRLGWECLWSAEVDPQASAVLAHHHPESRNLGDITKIDGRELERPDVLVFGTPCQSFSVAGRRAGMDDPRGVLAFVALGIVGRVRPTWFVLENVPGLLSSSQGRDFGAFLRAVDELGYSGAWASPDAQFFGLAQRRERVFFVGHSGDWRYPTAVLSQFSRLCGHPAPSREKGEGTTRSVAPGLTGSGRGTERVGESRGQDPVVVVPMGRPTVDPLVDEAMPLPELLPSSREPRAGCLSKIAFGGNNTSGSIGVSMACNHHTGRYDFESETLIAFSCKDSGNDVGENANAGGQVAVAFSNPAAGARSIALGNGSPPLKAGAGGNMAPLLHQAMSVRRLTPRECERLQGFEDDYTLIPYGKKGKPMADGPRYKMIGNSMAVDVVEWLLARIEIAA